MSSNCISVSRDIIKLRDGFGEKFAMFNFLLAAFIAYIINAFVHDWKLTLVLLSVAPLTTAATAIIRGVHSKFTEEEHKAYATSGTFAEEVFANIRTVTAFNGQAKEQAR